MPSALETLVKILKLEGEQGYKDTAVIGGLAKFSKGWSNEAHQQARKKEHHRLVDELTALLKEYDSIDSRSERHDKVTYMLDRITGRAEPPPEYQVSEEEKAEEERQAEQVSNRRKEAQGNGQSRPARTPPPRPRRSRRDDRRSRISDSYMKQERFDGFDDFEDDAHVVIPSQVGKRPRFGKMDIPQPAKLDRVPRRPQKSYSDTELAELEDGLNADVTVVRGIGKRLASTLEKLNITTVRDLLYHLPRRYDDYTEMTYISHLQPNMTTTVIGTVRSPQTKIGRNNRHDFEIVLDDGTAMMNIRFFGQGYLQRYMREGQHIVVRGTTSVWGNRIQMNNPEWEQLDPDNLIDFGIVPVYPLTEGLSARALRRVINNAVNYWTDRIPDHIPESVLERVDLPDLGWAIKQIHFPEGWDHLKFAKRRFIFDDLLLMQLAILQRRREWQSITGEALDIPEGFTDDFAKAVFPYELTGAQKRAIADIQKDVQNELPMNRLLQGDVGAGKTAVAIVSMMMAFAAGKQAALMAPTSILAEQHYRNIERTLEGMPEEVNPRDHRPVLALLTSALGTSERQSIYRGIADGSIDLVVGTHALIQEGVEFNDLGIAIVDEQHRFGTEQRGALRNKGKNPHLVVMTATPIPRTMALTIYADLDLSVIDEMPPGRIPVETKVIPPIDREWVFDRVGAQLEQGYQAFVVHPLVEASDKIDAVSAMEAYERLQQVFHRHRVGLLHGRMKPAEKDEIMHAFGAHEFDILVTTSVAEVGVDVPNATMMVIESADRFGLSQLHQFRGRVGRGGNKSYCYLIADGGTENAQERLSAMEQTTDGFELADIDWKIRGPGDLLGTRQSGRSLLALMNEITPQVVEMTQREARTIYEADPSLERPEHQLLARQVEILHNVQGDMS